MRADSYIARPALSAAILFYGAAFAVADHPDIIRNYRLIPHKSTLEQTGGFAGVDLNHTLFGRFELVQGFEDGVSCAAIGCPPPDHIPFARFEDVRVWAFNNHPAIDAVPVPLARYIDLEKLRGSFRPAEPHRLTFHGRDHQGRPFDLLAVQRGRLLHLVGASQPQCCDFFAYKIDALAHIAAYADFNLDGVVDRTDLNALLANIGTAAEATFADGDADGDGDVDGDDFLSWQQQIGTAVDMSQFAEDSATFASLSTATVPEPSVAALALACVARFSFYRRLRPKNSR